jgi:carbamoyltransferase
MVDGKIIIAAQEERFLHLKNFNGYPYRSIEYCLEYLKKNNLKLDYFLFSTIESVAFWLANPLQHYFKMKDYVSHYGDKYYSKKLKGDNVEKYFFELAERTKIENKAPLYLDYSQLSIEEQIGDTEKSRDLQRKFAANQCGIDETQIKFIDHHSCHAYYAYFASKRKDDNCAVITLDSDGDGLNQTVWHFKNPSEILKIKESNQCDLARIYKITTLILGMKPDEHEFKVMGMAPYSKSEYVDIVYNEVYKPLLKVENGMVLHNNRPLDMYAYLMDKLKPFRFDNIAGAVQKLVEEISIQLITQIHELTGLRNFCLSGGVSMNIKMNMMLSQLDFVDNLYVPASGSDESLCMGACYFMSGGDSRPLENTYLGYDITNDISEESISEYFKSTEFEIFKNVDHITVAKILAEGNVLAVVRGREEFGARALGNRSIIASPNNPAVVKEINEAIKNRDFWMPFALSILHEYAFDYIDNPKKIDSPSMTIGFETLDINYNNIKAGTHPYDKTCRPQILKVEANPNYYSLIDSFRQITGIPALLNTSLNLHGDPICSTLGDTAYTFKNSGLNYLYINDSYLIRKRN